MIVVKKKSAEMRNKTPQKKTFIFVCHHRVKNMCENARVFTGFRSTKKSKSFLTNSLRENPSVSAALLPMCLNHKASLAEKIHKKSLKRT